MNNFYVTFEGIIIVIVLVILFIVVSVINMKTKKPDGCEENSNCETCLINCIHNENPLKESNKNDTQD